MNARLTVSWSGHLAIEFGDLSDADWQALRHRIVDEWGFQYVGAMVIGLDEHIFPSFERTDLTLCTGWDIWSGHYLLARCETGDECLQALWHTLQH